MVEELTHISLFAGIGGIDLAAEWAGFRTVLFVEIDPFCRKVLNKHWPDVPIIGDIRDVIKEKIMAYTNVTGGTRQEHNEANRCSRNIRGAQAKIPQNAGQGGSGQYPITLITGGFPCQPVSQAGKQGGKADDRWLWPEMLRVISEVRPTWVIAENVDGLKSMVEWDTVLEVDSKEYTEEEMAEGYLSVGEIRERRGRGSLDEVLESLKAIGYQVQPFELPACAVNAPHRRDRIFIVAHTKQPTDRGKVKCGEVDKQKAKRPTSGIGRPSEDVADTYDTGCSDRTQEHRGEPAQERERVRGTSRCNSIPNPKGKGLERADSERATQPWQWPTKYIGGDWWAVEPDVGRVAHGIPSRVDQLKALGNAVVPQQIYPILQAIVDIERSIWT